MDKLRKKIKSFFDLIVHFNNTKICRDFLEEQRWQGTPICPHCGAVSQKHYKLKIKGEYNGKYKCYECREVFTVTTGTMFHGSHIPLQKWFYAIYLFLSHKKGISSIQLAKDINVTQKSAWFMLNRIRYNMYGKMQPQFEDRTQIDETYVGGRDKGRIKGAQGGSLKIKVPVVGLLSDGKIKSIVVPSTNKSHLQAIIDGFWRYCGEFDFRYNTRKIDDFTKFVMFMVTGYRRLAYKELLAEYKIWGNL